MLRVLGMILLVGSVMLIATNIIRVSSSTVASARDDQGIVGQGQQAALIEVSSGLVRTVKYLVVPAALLLIGGVLVNNTRRDDRMHELRMESTED